ncbi:Carnitine palmitoyltransferase II [Fasciola hepatica]|uniref:Carnitine palmitoyltransferase II n=1 Tax=Fasciola hepatica TaxID=6192 RepID=A0A4E0S3M4_FASHE|nr:Carnitine palmitoyltransferase II [Fasciola hepatica]
MMTRIQNCCLLYHNMARFSTAVVTRSVSSQRDCALSKSVLPTDHFQHSLPTLKVPELEETVARYLKSQEAILDEEQLKKTTDSALRFLRSRGPTLQKELREYARTNRHTSYITKMWFDMYLSDRRPVVITHNPVIVFRNTRLGTGYQRPSIRAANLTHGIIHFAKLLRSNTLEPDIFHLNPKKSKTHLFHQTMRLMPKALATYAAYLFKAYPLDMSQYSSMFNGTRVPKPNKDELIRDTSAKHIVVIHKGHTYVFDVMDEHGNPIPPKRLAINLEFIISQPSLPHTPGVGTITTMSRDEAFIARQRLRHMGNGANLDLIDSAFITIVLDEADLSEPSDIVHNFLTGPSESRWFDKPISLIVDRRGQAAINFEHSWGDGVAVVRLCNEIYAASEASPAVSPTDLPPVSTQPSTDVRRLEWIIDDRTANEFLAPALLTYNQRRGNLVLDGISISDGLNKELCKAASLSPDAMMQLAFQMAYDCVHGTPAATYESCSTAAFKHGRTETIRSATNETRRCVRLMRRPSAEVHSSPCIGKPAANAVTDADLFSALASCSSKHNKLTKEAAMGQGWDRHLFALHHFAMLEHASGLPMPDIFLDDSYAHINRIVLSTSTLSSPAFSLGGFGPTTPDGYGIGYAVKDDHCEMMVSSWRNASTANASDFAQAFRDSSNRITTVIRSKLNRTL